ncbi:MAG: sigma-70 family RNA polymerase sigma factor [Acidobacteria bacterium]|nr:sigma-70 family RNA polymerase sigma factor [Acidobacteriota bacterium]
MNREEINRLVDLAKGGGAREIDDLLRYVMNYIGKRVISLTGKPADAEDISQEILYKISKSISGLKVTGKYFGWQEKIIRNSVTDYYRKKSTEPPNTELNHEEIERLSALPRKDNTDNSAVRKIMLGAGNKLSHREELAFYLREYEELSSKEIGELMGIKPVTARVLYTSASAKILKHLRKELGVETS